MQKRYCDKCGQEIGYENFAENTIHVHVYATKKIGQGTPGNLTFEAELCSRCAQDALYTIREVLGRGRENE